MLLLETEITELEQEQGKIYLDPIHPSEDDKRLRRFKSPAGPYRPESNKQ